MLGSWKAWKAYCEIRIAPTAGMEKSCVKAFLLIREGKQFSLSQYSSCVAENMWKPGNVRSNFLLDVIVQRSRTSPHLACGKYSS